MRNKSREYDIAHGVKSWRVSIKCDACKKGGKDA